MLDDEMRRVMGKISEVFQLVVEGPMQGIPRARRRELTKAWLEELDSTLHKEDEVVMNLLTMTLARKYKPEELFENECKLELSFVISLFDLAWNAGRLYEEELISSITIKKENNNA